jgi:hypothetical protein
VVDGVWAISRGQLIEADTLTAAPGIGTEVENADAARNQPQRALP